MAGVVVKGGCDSPVRGFMLTSGTLSSAQVSEWLRSAMPAALRRATLPSMAYAVQRVVDNAMAEAATQSGVIVATAAAPNAAAARGASFSATHGAAARASVARGRMAASAAPASAATTTPGPAHTGSSAAAREAQRTAAAAAAPVVAAAAATTVASVAAAATAAAGGAALAAAPDHVTGLGIAPRFLWHPVLALLWHLSLVALPCPVFLSPSRSAAHLWLPVLLRIPRRPMSRPVPPPSRLNLTLAWLVAASQVLPLQWPLPRLLPRG